MHDERYFYLYYFFKENDILYQISIFKPIFSSKERTNNTISKLHAEIPYVRVKILYFNLIRSE